jgi:hypothetical protein
MFDFMLLPSKLTGQLEFYYAQPLRALVIKSDTSHDLVEL